MEKTNFPPYLTDGIIAYIGNKRRLLGLIGQALRSVLGDDLSGSRFADPFAGSGVVSRFARWRGMEVVANDWEAYSKVLLQAWLQPRGQDIDRLFGSAHLFEEGLGSLNHLEEPGASQEYLAKYYAPANSDPKQADYRTERLFYTRENALKLDAARNFIDESPVPVGLSSDEKELRRSLMLAPLIYAAATHVNTSGVFKAYHKGFGGHGGDALGRILKPIVFSPPHIIEARPARVFSSDVRVLAKEGVFSDVDVVYLDPPYNQHQYGSNYHLLNTLVKWDRIPQPLEIGVDGSLKKKAGIRSDWMETRSEYCYRDSAGNAFQQLLKSLDAPYILVSYSTDGIIPFEELRTFCEAYGRLRMMDRPYVTYRGGRQSPKRRDGNIEFIMILEKGKSTRRGERKKMDRLLLARRLNLHSAYLFDPERLRMHGTIEGNRWFPHLPGARPEICLRARVWLDTLPSVDDIGEEAAESLLNILGSTRCRDRDEELTLIQSLWSQFPGEHPELVKEIPRILKKIAHRKYQIDFEMQLGAIRSLGKRYPNDFGLIKDEIAAIAELAQRRFQG